MQQSQRMSSLGAMKVVCFFIKKFLLFVVAIILLSFSLPVFTQEPLAITTIFIPVGESFDFKKGKIVDLDEGDINILHYGIEAAQSKIEIAQLKKGFIEDTEKLSSDENIEWSNFADYIVDMLYAVRCANNKFALFELVNIDVYNNEVTGMEIVYKYQPDGSRSF